VIHFNALFGKIVFPSSVVSHIGEIYEVKFKPYFMPKNYTIRPCGGVLVNICPYFTTVAHQMGGVRRKKYDDDDNNNNDNSDMYQ
jgi:hypothetical protein